jgi:ATP-dependent DNA helicase RecQ
LNNNLARYFGDQNSPEHCGHCSVCRGKTLVFAQPTGINDDIEKWDNLAEYAREFAQHIGNKSPASPITAVLITRFLTGLTQPIFTKVKARQLSGFGAYEERSYLLVLEAVTQLFHKH